MKILLTILGPLIFIAIGIYAKIIAKGKGKQEDDDFNFGVEISLLTLSSSLFYIVDSYDNSNSTDATKATIIDSEKVSSDILFIIVNFLIFLALLKIQQNHKGTETDEEKQKIRRRYLWYVSNGIGLVMFLVFIFFIKSK